MDGMKEFPDAINPVLPKTEIQLYIVHNSMKCFSWKDYKTIAVKLKHIYRSLTEDECYSRYRSSLSAGR